MYTRIAISSGDTLEINISNKSIRDAEKFIEMSLNQKLDHETNNLSDLIELTAKNIRIVYRFSGLLDFSYVNSIKRLLLKKFKKR